MTDRVELYPNRSTEDLFRMARMVTPPEDVYKWVATVPGRTWYRDHTGDWWSMGGDDADRPHRYDDEFMRDMLASQLDDYMITDSSSLWSHH